MLVFCTEPWRYLYQNHTAACSFECTMTIMQGEANPEAVPPLSSEKDSTVTAFSHLARKITFQHLTFFKKKKQRIITTHKILNPS